MILYGLDEHYLDYIGHLYILLVFFHLPTSGAWRRVTCCTLLRCISLALIAIIMYIDRLEVNKPTSCRVMFDRRRSSLDAAPSTS